MMVEKIRKNREKNVVFAAVSTDLSKAFDCIPNSLLKPKLNVFNFDKNSLFYISAYL